MPNTLDVANWNAPKFALKNRESRWLARPRKRHYTFARRLDQVTTVRVRHGAIASSKR
jgi:hypothetical protein